MTALHTNRRRGVILLVILGLMAMFGVTAIAFVVITSQGRRAAEAIERVDIQATSPRNDLNQAMLQAVRGSTNTKSILWPHSLMEDMYGNDSIEGQITGVPTAVANGQLFNFSTNLAADEARRRVGCVLTMLVGPAKAHSTRIVGFAAGTNEFQVVTFDEVTNADFASVDYTTTTGPHFVINGTAFSGTGFGFRLNYADVNMVLDAEYAAGLPYALLPNPTDPNYHQGLDILANEDYDAVDYQNMLLAMVDPSSAPADGRVPIPSLHRRALVRYWYERLATLLQGAPENLADEDEAWRAIVQPYGQDGTPSTGDELVSQATGDLIVQIKRRCILRPLTDDHPDFDGGNIWTTRFVGLDISGHTAVQLRDAVWELNGPWDIDNDGDGVVDSIWTDLGLPVRSLADGRLYRPLFAVHCVDMDGRLNLNAHGTVAQTDIAQTPPYQPSNCPLPDSYYAQVQSDGNYLFAGNQLQATIPRGQGAGPAEVNLWAIMPQNAAGQSQFAALMVGNSTIDGRYGESHLRYNSRPDPGPAYANFDATWMAAYAAEVPHEVGPGFSVDPAAAPDAWFNPDLLGVNKRFDATNNLGTLASFGTPSDLDGTMGIGLDPYGQPLFRPMRDRRVRTDTSLYFTFSGSNHPYEIDLSRSATHGLASPATHDNPFTAAELELLMRPFDVDSSHLPTRLTDLSPLLADDTTLTSNNALRRLLVTTESWDTPNPNLALPPELRDELKTNHSLGWARHVSDLLLARGVLPADMPGLLSSELLSDLRMDLNRAFGNGLDDNANEVVDEPWEAVNALDLLPVAGPYPNNTVPLDHDNDGTDGSVADPRRHYARHLYVLMMALVHDDWYPWWARTPAGPPPNWKADARAYAIAQWAVNVIDFRDRDSIMTPFEFDIEPFVDNDVANNAEIGIPTWDVDGDLPPDATSEPRRGLVWGCERPELLITESVAYHDRRTDDLDGDPLNGPEQGLKPVGSFFVELYNPWTSAAPWTANKPGPGEFYATGSPRVMTDGVLLNQTSLVGGDPVWRLAVCEPGAGNAMLDMDDSTLPTPVVVDRYVYFIVPGANPLPADTPNLAVPNQIHYVSAAAGGISRIRPHRYAVIGPGDPGDSTDANYPGEVRSNGKYASYIGFRTDDPGPIRTRLNQTRRILLDPNATPDTAGQVEVYGDGTTDDLANRLPAVAGANPNIAKPVGVVIDMPQRLSLTEPTGVGGGVTPGGYQADSIPWGTYQRSLGGYQPYLVGPEDGPHTDWAAILSQNTTVPNYRYVHLQRLANPLLAYDVDTNPYRTIDSASVDLTSFNGVDAADPAPASGDGLFTRQRGQEPDSAGAEMVWAIELPDPASPTLPATSAPIQVLAHVFDEDMGHSLGLVNEWYGGPATVASGVPDIYVGSAVDGPFPWLTWLDRPFSSELELMKVPARKSSDLLVAFETDEMAGVPVDAYLTGSEHFRHAMSLFTARPGTPGGPANGRGWGHGRVPAGAPVPAPIDPSHLYRVLEYVHVPSPFIGVETQGNPVALRGNAGGTHQFHPPFHHIPRYRQPGKINANTIFSEDVWNGLMNNPTGLVLPYLGTTWDEFVANRRGYGGVIDGNPLLVNAPPPLRPGPPLPTYFANPFRSFAGRELIPFIPGRDDGVAPLEAPQLGDIVGEGVHATLLRAKRDPATPDDPTTRLSEPLFAAVSLPADVISSTSRNPAFRYQGLQRLGNLVTTRSNVYAVWVTVGYFEVHRKEDATGAGVDTDVYHEGYELGRELGIDSGDVKRHRAFYIIDRSIPVGFQRGKDLNVEKAILLKRFIE